MPLEVNASPRSSVTAIAETAGPAASAQTRSMRRIATPHEGGTCLIGWPRQIPPGWAHDTGVAGPLGLLVREQLGFLRHSFEIVRCRRSRADDSFRRASRA